MPYCHKCGQRLSDDDRFCWKCGTPVASSATQDAQAGSWSVEDSSADKTQVLKFDHRTDEAAGDSTDNSGSETCPGSETYQAPSFGFYGNRSNGAGSEPDQSFDSFGYSGYSQYSQPASFYQQPDGYQQANQYQTTNGYQQANPYAAADAYRAANGYQQASQSYQQANGVYQGGSAPYQAPGYCQDQPFGAEPVSQPGALTHAWHDFKDSPDKLAITAKLALSQFLPGAGALMLDGYVCSWGKESALGEDAPLHKKIVRPGVLDSGLYAYGANLVGIALLALVCIILSALLGAIDAPGWLIAVIDVVLVTVGTLFILVMGLRAAICGRVRSGLNLEEVANMLFRGGNTGRFLVAALVPALLAALAELILTIVLALLVILLFGMELGALGSLSSLLGDVASGLLFTGGIGTAVAGIALVILYSFASFFCMIAAYLVSTRAFGYIIADFRPWEWPEYQENSGRYAQETL